ncbi:hypothetical protein QAD02_018153 [Eretmocerus hayati]|uniref:Uncharacterized protein n=1 Tax=Eretmocerus hayati TaxID=131215 RepID=A0ACC2PHU6_9HYME|nr:hypothetical protein QAD02_018153 [Eretmocerus hayati]
MEITDPSSAMHSVFVSALSIALTGPPLVTVDGIWCTGSLKEELVFACVTSSTFLRLSECICVNARVSLDTIPTDGAVYITDGATVSLRLPLWISPLLLVDTEQKVRLLGCPITSGVACCSSPSTIPGTLLPARFVLSSDMLRRQLLIEEAALLGRGCELLVLELPR